MPTAAPRRSTTPWTPIIAIAIGAAFLIVILASGGFAAYLLANRHHATGPRANPVYTKWEPDSAVTNGPEPGYKPQLTGLTGADLHSASASIDTTGTTWVVNVTFTSQGATKFDILTRENVNACPGDPVTSASANCAQRHLTIWLDLTQADIDQWEDPSYVAKVSAPYDLRCLASKTTSTGTTCGKFVTDPITLQEIAGGQVVIAGGFTQQQATELASVINAGS